MTDRDIGHPEIDPIGPPLEWFEGRGPEGVGIQDIYFSQTLQDFGGGEVGEQLGKWQHFIGSEGQGWRNAREASEMQDQNPLKESALFAEQVIRLETGFTPRQIMERTDELLGVFKGQFEAPFPVILWHQRE